MAETAKKAKKKKGKTIALTEFLAKEGENGPSPAAVFSARSTSWADESENLNTEVDTSWPEESYGGISTENRLRAARDRAALPTAPRAARGPDIDSTKIPDGPPFTAFLGNLSYDVDKDDILEFFGNKKITEVRLPQDNNGRPKGFGYAEFEDKESLIAALILNNEHLKNRRIRVDVAGQQHQERERGDRDRRDEPDRTDGDWRSKAEPQPDQNGYNDRDRHYDDMGSRDRWGPRGYDSGPRDRSGYRGFDDGPRDRSGYGRDRGFDDGPRGRDFGPPDRRGDDRYGDRDRGKGFGSGWDHGDRERQDDRGYDRSDSGYGRSDNRRYGDRFGGDRDRGGGFGRDRAYDDRRAGDRFGGDRSGGDRFGGDRSGGDRFGGDRYGGERFGGDRYGDRGGGYGRDRHDDRRYEDRRYDDRRGGERFGDRDRRRDYDDRERERSSWRDSRDARSDFDRDEREPVKERPRLQLQPRTKPVEETKDEPVLGSSVFGGAKPVDTAAKEREIEEKLARQKLEDDARLKQEKEKQKERRERDEWPRGSSGRARRDSNRSSDGERGPKERRDSNRRDSARSSDEGLSGKESETPPRESPRGGDGKESKEFPKEVPKDAPPPVVNVWTRRMEQQKAASTTAANADKTEPKSPTEERRVEINVDSSSMTVTSSTTPTSPDRKGFFGKPTGPKKDFRESRDGGGAPRGRGRGVRSDRGDRSERVNANDPERGGGRGVRKEKRERKPAEPKRYEENPQPVFHTASKFSALLADEDPTEQDTEEQFDEKSET